MLKEQNGYKNMKAPSNRDEKEQINWRTMNPENKLFLDVEIKHGIVKQMQNMHVLTMFCKLK